MKKFIISIFAIILIFTCTACTRRDNLDEISSGLSTYNIDINFDMSTKSAKCSETIAYVNNTDEILREVKFHLYPQFFEEGATEYILSSTKYNTAYPNGMSYGNFDVSRVQVDNADTGVVYEGEHDGILKVSLNNSLIPDEIVEITIDFEFTLPNCCHRFGYGNNTINLGNFYPIACVYENGSFNTNPYNANGDPFYSDMANYLVNLTTDNSLVIASTGEKSVTTEGNESIYKIEQKAVRDFAIVMSEKFKIKTAKCDNTSIEYYYYDDINADRSLQAGVDAIRTFSKKFLEKVLFVCHKNFCEELEKFDNILSL